jgi:hypothetical protein
VLGVINGIKQGGVQGYTGAAINAAGLYSAASAADVAAGGAGFAGAGAAASAGAAALPIAMFTGMYDLFNKQSTQSPLSQYEMSMADSKSLEAIGTNEMAPGQSQQTQQWGQGTYNEGESMAQVAHDQLNGIDPLTGQPAGSSGDVLPEISPTTNFAWATPSMSLGARHNIQQS